MEHKGCQEGKAIPKITEVFCPSCGKVIPEGTLKMAKEAAQKG